MSTVTYYSFLFKALSIISKDLLIILHPINNTASTPHKTGTAKSLSTISGCNKSINHSTVTAVAVGSIVIAVAVGSIVGFVDAPSPIYSDDMITSSMNKSI